MFNISSYAQTIPTLDLTPDMDGVEVSSFLRYKVPYDGDITHEALMQNPQGFQALETNNIHFGVPNGKILILLRVRNQSNESGNWILTTNRGSLKYFRLYELAPGETTILINGDDKDQVKHNLQSYQSFSHEVVLNPQDEKTYAIHFEPENIAYMPLELKTYSSFFKARTANIALVATVVGGLLVLIFFNVGFFWITGKQEFVWLGLAEIALAINALHTEGYTTVYWLYDKPFLGLAFGDIVKCGFVAAMSQVARTFIRTRKNFPKTDKILIVLIMICFAVCFLQIGVKYYSAEMKAILHGTSWTLLLIMGLYLPFVAVITVRRLGIEYWPLIPAWGSLCALFIYAIVATIGIFPSLPFYWSVAGPLSLFEAAMITLALGLHVRKIHTDKMLADEKLTKSLVDKLDITEKAKTLADQKAAALATIHDQNSILHAAGHDSRQVVFALNSAIAHLDNTDSNNIDSNNVELSNMLKASSDYLNDIISVTMSGANMVDGGSQFVCLEPVETKALLNALGKIYAPIFKKRGLYYKTNYHDVPLIISDSALLMRIISNIISNSLKFTTTGGLELEAEVSDQAYVVTITDTGSGMSEAMLASLNSNEFTRKKEIESSEGSGSGLNFAKNMIAYLGGNIHIESVENKYTRVRIELPNIVMTTPVTIAQLTELKPEFSFIDVDNQKLVPELSGAPIKIAVTYDNSSTTRAFLSEQFDLMLLKPLHKEVLEHPSLKTFLQNA